LSSESAKNHVTNILVGVRDGWDCEFFVPQLPSRSHP